jgi:hypothetical protein
MTPKEIKRQKKLEKLQDEHGTLTREKEQLQSSTNKRVKEINIKLKELGQAIYDLKNLNGDTPHVTDHAIVRYLERVEGQDIWELKAKVMNHAKAVRVVNTIVTVNGEGEEDGVV